MKQFYANSTFFHNFSSASFHKFYAKTMFLWIFLIDCICCCTNYHFAFELFFQVFKCLGLPNFPGKLDWKNSPKAEVTKCRNKYNLIKSIHKKIVQAKHMKKDAEVEELWDQLEWPFLSLSEYENLLAPFGKIPRNKEKST